MRWLALIPLLLTACGNDPTPAAPIAPELANAAAAEQPAPIVTAELGQIAERLLQGSADRSDRSSAAKDPAAAAAAILAAASKGSPAEQGRAPAALSALGNAALPQLAATLRHQDPGQRRIAALTLLQLGTELHANGNAGLVLSALAAARSDSDAAVRAAAELAYQRASGDTGALDASRAAHEAALRTGR